MLTDAQVENWRKVLSMQMGPVAFILPREAIEQFKDDMQKHANEMTDQFLDELPPLKQENVTFEDLFNLKVNGNWFSKVVTATTKVDVTMHVWNGIHPVEKNTAPHVCKAGTRVRVWMVSRFGDVGITDNMTQPHGYDARVDPEKLKDITIENVPPSKD